MDHIKNFINKNVKHFYSKWLGEDDINWALYKAADSGILLEVALLILAGADLEKKDSSLYTPLHKAAANHHNYTMKVLIWAKANINARTHRGFTAVSLASRSGNIAGVKLLIKEGIEPKAISEALIEAVLENHPEIVDILIQAGATVPTKATGLYGTLLELAVRKNMRMGWSIYNGMPTKRIDEVISYVQKYNVDYKNNFDKYTENWQPFINKRIKTIQLELFALFGACILKKDNENFATIQPPELIALQLSERFPEWYRSRLEEDLELVFKTLNKMAVDKPTFLNKAAACFLPCFKNQSEDTIQENDTLKPPSVKIIPPKVKQPANQHN